MELKTYLNKYKKIVDAELDKLLPEADCYPKDIHKAMRYAVFAGNSKRIRPILAITSCLAMGGRLKSVLKVACTIELVHSYSLVHDDLPAMDNSDYRRGKFSVHKKFGEDTAILCGDALLTLAFKILSGGDNPKKNCLVIDTLAAAIGSHGMIGGQLIDMMIKDKITDLPTMEYVISHKTGALIKSSLEIGAICAGANKKEIRVISQFGEYVGFGFQVVDDILDKDGITEIIGINESFDLAKDLIIMAKGKVNIFGKKADTLNNIADFVLERNS